MILAVMAMKVLRRREGYLYVATCNPTPDASRRRAFLPTQKSHVPGKRDVGGKLLIRVADSIMSGLCVHIQQWLRFAAKKTLRFEKILAPFSERLTRWTIELCRHAPLRCLRMFHVEISVFRINCIGTHLGDERFGKKVSSKRCIKCCVLWSLSSKSRRGLCCPAEP